MANKIYTLAIQADTTRVEQALQRLQNELNKASKDASFSPNVDYSNAINELKQIVSQMQAELNKLRLDKINTHVIDTKPIDSLLASFTKINKEIETLDDKLKHLNFSAALSDMNSSLEQLRTTYHDIQKLFGVQKSVKIDKDTQKQIQQYQKLLDLNRQIQDNDLEDKLNSPLSKYKNTEINEIIADYNTALKGYNNVANKIQEIRTNYNKAVKAQNNEDIKKYAFEMSNAYSELFKKAQDLNGVIASLDEIYFKSGQETPEKYLNVQDKVTEQIENLKKTLPSLLNQIQNVFNSQNIDINNLLDAGIKGKNGKLKIPVSIELTHKSKDLTDEVNRLLDNVRTNVKPIEVGIQFVSKYRSKAIIQKELSNPSVLEENLQKTADSEIYFEIRSNIKMVSKEINDELQGIKSILKDTKLTLPTIELAPSWKEFKTELSEVKTLLDEVKKGMVLEVKQPKETTAKKTSKTKETQTKKTNKEFVESLSKPVSVVENNIQNTAEIAKKGATDVTTTVADLDKMSISFMKSLNAMYKAMEPLLTKLTTSVRKDITNSMKEISNSFLVISNNSVESINKIITAIQQLATTMRVAFNLPSNEELDSQWKSIEEKYNKMASSDGNIDGRKKATKELYSSFIDDINNYQSKGGTKTITELTNNVKTIDKIKHSLNDMQINKASVDNVALLTQAVNRLSESLKKFENISDLFETSLTTINSSTQEMDESLKTWGESLKSIKTIFENLTTSIDQFSEKVGNIDLAKGITEKDLALGISDSRSKMKTSIYNLGKLDESVVGTPKIDAFENEALKIKTEFTQIQAKIDEIHNKSLDMITTDDLSDLSHYNKLLEQLLQKYKALINNNDFNIHNNKGTVIQQNMQNLDDAVLKQTIEQLALNKAGEGGVISKAFSISSADVSGIRVLTGEIRSATGEITTLRYEVDTTLGTLRQFSTVKMDDVLKKDTSKAQETMKKRISNIRDIIETLKTIDGDGKIGSFTTLLNELEQRVNSIENTNKQNLKVDVISEEELAQMQTANGELANIEKQVKKLGSDTSFDKVNRKGTLLGEGLFGGNVEEVLKYVDQIAGKQGKITKAFTVSNIDGSGFVTLRGQVESLDGRLTDLIYTYDQYNDVLRFNSNISRQSVSGFEAVTTGLGKITNIVKEYFTAYRIVNAGERIVRSGITQVKSLDDAFTEMKKVSDESVQTLKQFSKESFGIARTISSTGLEIQQSSANWIKLGYSIKEAGELARNSALYANVGDMNIETATEHVLSSVKAFKDEFSSEVEASAAVVDRFNEIGNNYAISSADLGSSLERSGAALVAAGNNLNQALGLTTAANLIQQDADTVGNALKVISLRTRGAKTELEEMGEDTTDLADSTSKLRDEMLALTGVDILKNGGSEFKSTYEMFDELSQVWDKLSDLSRANVLEKIAGKTRASIAAGLIENFNVARDVVKSAENASGSAMRENQAYAESISGHLDQLKNKWQEVWANAVNRDVINFVLDLGTALLGLVDTLGLLPTLLGGLSFAGLSNGGGRDKELSLCK